MAGEIALDLWHRFESGVEVEAALARAIPPGSVLVLFGPSGAGKTTVLRAVAGLLRPQRGRLRVDGRDWFDATRRVFVPPQDRRIAYVAQESALFPHLTVRANVEYGLRAAQPAACRRRADEMLYLVGARGLEERLPRELSGGQSQRVALARALAPAPTLLLLDEPFGALDAPNRRELRSEVRGLLRETATSAILVTHDRLEAMAMGDDMAVMVGGALRQSGRVGEVFQRPADPAVARALGVETVLPAIVEHGEEGLVSLRIGGTRLVAVAADPCAPGDEVFACVRAEDVALEQARATLGSVRNRMPGRVVRIEHEGPVDRVTVDCGFPLVAAVTCQSREELALATGMPVTATVKATAIHIVPKL